MTLAAIMDEVAASMMRASRHALGLVPPPDWDGLPEEERAPFLLAARRGPDLLERMDGATWREVARALFRQASPDYEGGWEALPEPYKVAWEVVARHLAALMEADDVEPADLEVSWGEWAKRRGHAA